MPAPRDTDVRWRSLFPWGLRRYDWLSAVPEACYPTWPAFPSADDFAGYDS